MMLYHDIQWDFELSKSYLVLFIMMQYGSIHSYLLTECPDLVFHLYTEQQVQQMIEDELGDPKYNTKLTVEVEDKDVGNLQKQAEDNKRRDMKERQPDSKKGRAKAAIKKKYGESRVTWVRDLHI